MSTPKGGYSGAFSFCFPGLVGLCCSGENPPCKSILSSQFFPPISLDNFAFLFPGLERAQPKREKLIGNLACLSPVDLENLEFFKKKKKKKELGALKPFLASHRSNASAAHTTNVLVISDMLTPTTASAQLTCQMPPAWGAPSQIMS